jgi:hypothetical protein
MTYRKLMIKCVSLQIFKTAEVEKAISKHTQQKLNVSVQQFIDIPILVMLDQNTILKLTLDFWHEILFKCTL